MSPPPPPPPPPPPLTTIQSTLSLSPTLYTINKKEIRVKEREKNRLIFCSSIGYVKMNVIGWESMTGYT